MQGTGTHIEQIGRIGTYLRDDVPYMHVVVEAEPGRPNCVRVVMTQDTWDAIKADRDAMNLYYETAPDFPLGPRPLFGRDYRQATLRHRGDLPSQAWHANLH